MYVCLPITERPANPTTLKSIVIDRAVLADSGFYGHAGSSVAGRYWRVWPLDIHSILARKAVEVKIIREVCLTIIKLQDEEMIIFIPRARALLYLS